MARGSIWPSRLIIRVADDTVDNSITTCPPTNSDMRFKSTKKGQTRHVRDANRCESLLITDTSNRQLSSRTSQQRPRKVFFADEITVKSIKRIPKCYATDIWYKAIDMDRFRMDVLNCKELRFEVKLKSARSHNHMRRVLVEHRGRKGKQTTTCAITRNSHNLSSVSMKSSKKPKEVAIKRANSLEQEVVDGQSFMNPRISSCFGPSHRWVFDYYLGSMIDTLCTVI